MVRHLQVHPAFGFTFQVAPEHVPEVGSRRAKLSCWPSAWPGVAQLGSSPSLRFLTQSRSPLLMFGNARLKIALLVLNSSTFAFKGLAHATFEISRAPGASVTDMRHVVSWFALNSVRLRHVPSTTFVAKCLRRWQRVLFGGVCLLAGFRQTQYAKATLPLSTLRSSSPCASWAAPLSGVCAGSATGFPRTAPTCLRAVGVDALPCPGGLVACGAQDCVGRRSCSSSCAASWSSPPPARALRPLELGQVESFRRIARLRLGLPAAEERAAGPPMAAPGVGGGNPATSPASSFASPSKAWESEVPSNRVSPVKSVTTMVHGSLIRRLHWGS